MVPFVGAVGDTGRIVGEKMAKKPNYRFERSERDRKKSAKKAARLAEKQGKAAARKDPEPDQPTPDSAADKG
jgi:hypothetical protein